MRAFVLSVVILLAACSPTGSSPIPASPAPFGSAAPSPLSSGACIDRADLADVADVVINVLQAFGTDMKASNVAQAKADITTASTGLKKLADLANPVRPDAAADFRSAATGLASAVSQLPGSQSLVDKAQTDFEAGLTIANAATCPA